MSNIENISVVSTYATDRLIDAKTMEVRSVQRGGPVLYIVRALEELGLKPEVYTGEEMLVEILVKDDDEFGKIHEPRITKTLPNISTKSAIVSTLLREWDLSNAENYSGKLFVDIQGYVRDGSEFGKKKKWENIVSIAPYIFCLKGNDIEIAMLPAEVVKDQKKNRMLIITKDKKGVDVFYKGQYLSSEPNSIINPPNTIGAGDTFFANFVYQFIKTSNAEKSAIFALNKTSDFLSEIK